MKFGRNGDNLCICFFLSVLILELPLVIILVINFTIILQPYLPFNLDNDQVVAYFSCITALENIKHQKKRKYREDDEASEGENNESSEENRVLLPGFSFWIVVDWPDHSLQQTLRKNC